MRGRIETITRWASLVLGALILVSCTAAGGVEFGLGRTHWWAGILGGVAGFAGGLLVVGALFGWLYVYFLFRRDLESIHKQLDDLKANTGRPDAPT